MSEPIELEDVVARWGEESLTIDDAAIDALLGRDVGPWIPLAEAEEVAGVSRSTLRAWYRSGRIPSRLMPGPHGLQRLVPREAVLEQAARSPRTGSGPATPATKEAPMPVPPASTDAVRLAEMAVNEARDRAAAAEARAEAAEAALHAALERAAAAETELRLLRDRPTPR